MSEVSRRELLRTAAGVALASGVATAQAPAGDALRPVPVRVGMCDWSLGKTGDVTAVQLAYQCGLDGVEASVTFPDRTRSLRNPEHLRAYRDACHKYSIQVPSVALGVLNSEPLKSEPKTALWVADSIGIAEKLGATCMLIAFFGRGEIDMQDREGVTRIVEVLRELAPRAADAGVELGLENTLSAEDNLRILEQVNHPSVMVYYDPGNSAPRGRDCPAEIRALKGKVCQVHLKNGDHLLSEKGIVDCQPFAAALKETGYDGWYVLETSSPSGDLVADTRKNAEYVRATF